MTETLSDAHHPAPSRHSAPRWMSALGLFGGPAAWFAQLNIGYVLTSQPCYAGDRLTEADLGDAFWIVIAAYVLCLFVALTSAVAATAMLRRVGDEVGGDSEALLEIGGGRTRFLAQSGQFLGYGFAFVIFLNIVGLALVPTCAG